MKASITTIIHTMRRTNGNLGVISSDVQRKMINDRFTTLTFNHFSEEKKLAFVTPGLRMGSLKNSVNLRKIMQKCDLNSVFMRNFVQNYLFRMNAQ